jgi:hypothetical protein
MRKYLLLFLYLFINNTLLGNNFGVYKFRQNISGNISFPMKINRHDEYSLTLKVSPYYGIFITNNIEQRIIFNLDIKYIFSKEERMVKTPLFWDLSWTSLYYFKSQSSWSPYVGGGLGLGFMDMNIYSINILLDIPVGIIFMLNNNFAIDIGIPIRIRISPRAFFDSVEIPVGVVGIRYFF